MRRGVRRVDADDGDIRDVALFDIGAGERLDALLTGHQAKITQLGVVRSADRPLLVDAAADNTIRVWDFAVLAQRGCPHWPTAASTPASRVRSGTRER